MPSSPHRNETAAKANETIRYYFACCQLNSGSDLSACCWELRDSWKDGLPRTQTFDYYDPPDENGEFVEFRLIYKGQLPAEGSSGARTKEKQLLRKEFHKQLRELWRQHPDLRQQAESKFYVYTTPDNQVSPPGPGVRQIVLAPEGHPNAKTWVEHIADDHQRCGGRFVPLVSKAGGFTCSLEILFLRRDNPGGLIVSGGGDIDNRIKVLFDGLRMPQTMSELGGLPLELDENPFFCLLEDDSLITSVSVTTDRLLVPMDSEEKINHVYLIIHVTVLNPSALFAGNRLV